MTGGSPALRTQKGIFNDLNGNRMGLGSEETFVLKFQQRISDR